MKKYLFLPVFVCLFSCHLKKETCDSENEEQEEIAASSPRIAAEQTTEDFENAFKEFREILADKPQMFTVQGKAVKKIKAINGLCVTVDPAKLETLDGQQVSGEIIVSIREMKTAKEMIANNCPTVSDGQLLVSGGAYFVGMTNQGRELRIKKGKSLQIQFPGSPDDRMELFYGERTEDGMMNWKPVNKKLSSTKANKIAGNSLGTSLANQNPVPLNPTRAKMIVSRKFPTKEWAAFDDSVVQARLQYILCNSKTLSTEQVIRSWIAPFKIARSDTAKYGMRKWSIIDGRDFSLMNWYAKYNPGFFLVSYDNNSDSVFYYKDLSRPEIYRKVDPQDTTFFVNDVNYYNTAANSGSTIIEAGIDGNITDDAIEYYQPVEIASLGWINVDKFYNPGGEFVPQYTLQFKDDVPNELGVYAIFRNMNSMLSKRVKTFGRNNVVIEGRLPVNSSIDLLVYSKMNGQFVQCKQTVTVKQDMLIPVELTPAPKEQIKKIFFN